MNFFYLCGCLQHLCSQTPSFWIFFALALQWSIIQYLGYVFLGCGGSHVAPTREVLQKVHLGCSLRQQTLRPPINLQFYFCWHLSGKTIILFTSGRFRRDFGCVLHAFVLLDRSKIWCIAFCTICFVRTHLTHPLCAANGRWVPKPCRNSETLHIPRFAPKRSRVRAFGIRR